MPTNIKALVFDFSKVLLFAKDPNYTGDLNPLNRRLLEQDKNYPFLDYFYLNQELLNYLKTVINKRLIIFTSGTIQDASAIQKNINDVFEAVYSAEKMGVSKSEPQAFTELCAITDLEPRDILFVDDTQRNLDAAAENGIKTVLFTGNQQLFAVLDKLK